jgi:imidazolonepropionase-like amidohydrolase/Tol biopolymer transport system component
MEFRCKKGINITKNIIKCWIIVFSFFLVISCETRMETKEISFEVQEGTELAFDLSPDGQTIVFDLLGQIWLLPVEGGEAHAITDSIKENSEHLYPTFTADGKSIVFWDASPTGWGLTVTSLTGDDRKELTKVSTGSDDFFPACSPFNSLVAFARQRKLFVADIEGVTPPTEIPINGVRVAGITDPAWSADGNHLAFVNARADQRSHAGGRVWQILSKGGAAEPLTPEKLQTRSPSFSPDGQRIAYFAREDLLRYQLWVQDLDGAKAKRLTEHEHVTPLSLRWYSDGDELIYCAEGRLWRISSSGGQPKEIPFTARLSIERKLSKLKDFQFAEWGEERTARGHKGLAISPDGEKIAAIVLGKLWVLPVEGEPEVISELPITAAGLSWSPESDEIVWAAGPPGAEDLFITNIETRKTRRLTEIPGMEVRASWSPDGKYIAFVHRLKMDSVRVVQSDRTSVSELGETLGLLIMPTGVLSNIIGHYLDNCLSWSHDSKSLIATDRMASYVTTIEGKTRRLKNSTQVPIKSRFHTQYYEGGGSILFEGNSMLWRAPFDLQSGVTGEAIPVSQDAAIYSSVARDGSVLYISGDGLRLRRPDGKLKQLGWPFSYKVVQTPNPLLIHNTRIIDGKWMSITQPCDLLVEEGRIKKIAPKGKITSSQDIQRIDAGGRVMIPGLIDAHIHIQDQSMLPAILFEGITTVRDVGSEVAWMKSFQESIETGLQAGPRIIVGGNPVNPASKMHIISSHYQIYGEAGFRRHISLAKAFSIDFIKMYLPRNSHSGNQFIQLAHESGFPVSSHMAYPLPLIAAGIDTKEHLSGLFSTLGPRFGGMLYNDIIQLMKAADVKVVPTSQFTRALRKVNKAQMEKLNDSPFLSEWLKFNRGPLPTSTQRRKDYERVSSVARRNVGKFNEAGVNLATGTDNPVFWLPWALHIELEELVQAGLTPMEAIIAATQNAARALRAEKEIGSIEVGKLADFVILDANPLDDIRNARKIWKVIKSGKVVDRDALQNWLKHEAEVVANVGK